MTKVTHLSLDERGELSNRRLHLREISGGADAPLDTVGQDLRAARLRRGDELAQISRALRIRKDHLEAIEEDRVEALPGRTYAVGFVRSYAQYLGLDSVECVERFKSEIAGRSDGAPQVGAPPDDDDARLPHGWMVMAVVVLGVVIYGAYHLARSADRLSTDTVAPVPSQIAPKPVLPSPPKPAPLQARASAAMPASQPGVAAAPSQPQGARPGTAAPVATAALPAANPASRPVQTGALSSATQPKAPALTAPQAAQQTASLQPAQVYGAQNRDARIVLRATAPTRVLVQGPDGRVYLNRVLQPGDSYRVPDRVGLSLTATDGGALGVELDGQQVGRAGKPGQMTEALSLDPQAVVDRQNGNNPE